MLTSKYVTEQQQKSLDRYWNLGRDAITDELKECLKQIARSAVIKRWPGHDKTEECIDYIYKELLSNWAIQMDCPVLEIYVGLATRAAYMYSQVEHYSNKFGEQHRQVINEALIFLDKREKSWELDEPIDRSEYLRSILGKIKH